MFTAVVLAGGGSRRFADAGLAVDKLALGRDGRTLLAEVVDGARTAGASAIVVVGHHQASMGDDIVWSMEDPTGGGPLAGLAAGITDAEHSVVVVLAGDAPRGPLAITALLTVIADAPPEVDAVSLVDDGGRLQMLCAAYRTDVVRCVLSDLVHEANSASHPAGGLHGAPMRLLTDRLRIATINDTWSAALDIDTPRDAERDGYA